MNSKNNINVTFFHAYKKISFSVLLLKNTIKKMNHYEKNIPPGSIQVIFCSNYVIKKLNKLYRNINRSTDVLSFNFNDSDLLGEIYISVQKATVQAQRFGVSLEQEINRLFIHGFFHLQGYDHETEKQRIAMETHEKLYTLDR